MYRVNDYLNISLSVENQYLVFKSILKTKNQDKTINILKLPLDQLDNLMTDLDTIKKNENIIN